MHYGAVICWLWCFILTYTVMVNNVPELCCTVICFRSILYSNHMNNPFPKNENC